MNAHSQASELIDREPRLVHRPTTELRPHPVYLELRGPLVGAGVRGATQFTGEISDPLLITTDGTILDGHVRWQTATARRQLSLPCIEHDLSKAGALELLLARHQRTECLNAYCRIVMALQLEGHYRVNTPQRSQSPTNSSNLTKTEGKDVRAEIARAAGVSTGNVTKVKQLRSTVSAEVRESLRQGEVSIHRAWEWRKLSEKQQDQALWEHRHHGQADKVIRLLIAKHTSTRRAAPSFDQLRELLGPLATSDTAVAVTDIPGKAIVITRECLDELLRRKVA